MPVATSPSNTVGRSSPASAPATTSNRGDAGALARARPPQRRQAGFSRVTHAGTRAEQQGGIRKMTRARRLATLAAAMAILPPGHAAEQPRQRPAQLPRRRGASAATASAGPSEAAAASPAPSIDTTPVTITVWDYYGESTPVKPALAGFQKEYPWITVDYQAVDWDSMSRSSPSGSRRARRRTWRPWT